jgi:hypothetical protein
LFLNDDHNNNTVLDWQTVTKRKENSDDCSAVSGIVIVKPSVAKKMRIGDDIAPIFSR